MSYQAKAAQYKVDEVNTLLDLIKEYPVIGILNVENLPSQQLQALRSKLRERLSDKGQQEGTHWPGH